jgi:hypothetical protein
MTDEDVIRMAIEAGFDEFWGENPVGWFERAIPNSIIEKFAALIAAAERDACAKLVDYWEARQGEHSEAIRARGKHD